MSQKFYQISVSRAGTNKTRQNNLPDNERRRVIEFAATKKEDEYLTYDKISFTGDIIGGLQALDGSDADKLVFFLKDGNRTEIYPREGWQLVPAIMNA